MSNTGTKNPIVRVLDYIRREFAAGNKIHGVEFYLFILPESASNMLTALSTGSYWQKNDDDTFKDQALKLFREAVKREYTLKIIDERKELEQKSENFVTEFLQNLGVDYKSLIGNHKFLLEFLDKKNTEDLSFDAFERQIKVFESPLDDYLPRSLGLLVESYAGPVRFVPLIVAISFILANYLVDCIRDLYDEHDFSIINLLKQSGIDFSLSRIFFDLNWFIANTPYEKFLRYNTVDNWYLRCFLNEIIVQSQETQWLGGRRCKDIDGSTMVSLDHVVSYFKTIKNIDNLIVFIFMNN
jgi:hypothetical protein